jgi:hypothetical protein
MCEIVIADTGATWDGLGIDMPRKLEQYHRERFDNQDLEILQDRIEQFLRQVYSSDILTGVLLQNIAVTTGVTQIPHSLGRIPIGVILVKNTVQLDIWQPTAATRAVISIQGSAASTVSLWVF